MTHRHEISRGGLECVDVDNLPRRHLATRLDAKWRRHERRDPAAGTWIYHMHRRRKNERHTRYGRTELQVLLDFLRPGDALVVTRWYTC